MPLKTEKRKFKDGKTSKNYWIRGTVAGREIFESTGTTIFSVAEKYRIKREAELIDSANGIESPLFIEALISYEANGGETTYNETLIQFLGQYPLDQVDQDLIDEKAREAYPTQSNSSVKRWFYDPVVAIMRHAHKKKMCALILIEKPKVKRPPPQWAEMEWFEAFWPYCNKELLALTTFLPYTGCRVTEALNLTWDRVSFERCEAYIPETKNDIPRTVHLPPDVIRTLGTIKKDAGKVFPWGDRNAANMAIRRAVERANKARAQHTPKPLEPIPYRSSHKIGSHTYATWMKRYAKMDAVGFVGTGRWKDPESTYIYTHTIASEESKKSDLLPRAKSVQTLYKPRKT